MTPMMIQVGPGKWLNPRYIVAAVLHNGEDGRERTLTLTLDSTMVAEAYPDITGPWIERVMQALMVTEI